MGIRNLAQVKRGHDLILAGTQNILGQALEVAGVHAEQHVHRFAKFKRRTGRLQDSTTHKIVRTSNGRILKIQNPTNYAPFVEYGTRAHGPRTARFLRFRLPNGRLVFARRVRGIRPYKFLYNATDAAHRVGGQVMRDGMSKIAKKFSF